MYFLIVTLFAQIVPGPFYLPEKVRLNLPDGWKDVLPRPEERTPRLSRLLENKKLGARIAVVLAPPDWTGPGVAIGRLAKWTKAAGCKVDVSAETENAETAERWMTWERCPDRPDRTGKILHKRIGVVLQDRDAPEFLAYPLGPTLQFSGSWPKRHGVQPLIDFDKIMSSATVLP